MGSRICVIWIWKLLCRQRFCHGVLLFGGKCLVLPLFYGWFSANSNSYLLRKTLQHWLLAEDPYTISPGYVKVILHPFSAFTWSSKECFLQGKSLPLETGPDTALAKFNVGKCPAVAERGAECLTSQPPWKTPQCWLVLQSEDTRNLCPGHPTPCRGKRPYLTSSTISKEKQIMSIVEKKVRWKILTYYSHGCYWVQTVLITLGHFFSCHISRFYLRCPEHQKCVWMPASEALLPLCQLLVAHDDDNN